MRYVRKRCKDQYHEGQHLTDPSIEYLITVVRILLDVHDDWLL